MRGYAAVGLHNPKNGLNIGSALRACGVYGAAMLAIDGERQKYVRVPTDTMKAYRKLPFLKVSDLREVIPHDCVPVAVDIVEGAQDLRGYKHPERAFYIFGAEDATLGEKTLSWCRDVVYIPTQGCMNLAATVNVILYDRFLKSTNSCSSFAESTRPSV